MKLKLLALTAITSLSFTLAACSDGNAASVSYEQGLHAAAGSAKSSVIETLEKLVNIETGTYDAIGIPEMGNYLETRLRALGATTERFAAADGQVGDNIVGKLSGSGTNNILLMAHFDTVYPRGTLAKAPFRIEGEKAYGPGISDSKSGVAVVLHALELLRAQNFSNYKTITILFNTDEEKGSFGSRELIQNLASQSDYVMSFEPGGNTITTGTSGIAYVDAIIQGKASHAGVAPLDGINALTVASDFVMRTQDIQDIPNERAFNWTMATAGVSSNTIAPQATLRGDMRYGVNESFDAMSATLQSRALSPYINGATITVNITRGRPAFNMNEQGYKVAEKMISTLADVGVQAKLATTRAGAGSDAAYAALSGKPVVEGFGLSGDFYHSTPGMEYVDLDSVPERLYLAAKMIKELGNGI